jgi:hypothetical protein
MGGVELRLVEIRAVEVGMIAYALYRSWSAKRLAGRVEEPSRAEGAAMSSK